MDVATPDQAWSMLATIVASALMSSSIPPILASIWADTKVVKGFTFSKAIRLFQLALHYAKPMQYADF